MCKTLKQLSTRLSLMAYCNEIPRISPQACPKRLITVFSAIMRPPPPLPDLTDLAIVRIISAHCTVSIWLPGTCIRLLSFLILYNNDNNSNNLVQDIMLWSYSLTSSSQKHAVPNGGFFQGGPPSFSFQELILPIFFPINFNINVSHIIHIKARHYSFSSL